LSDFPKQGKAEQNNATIENVEIKILFTLVKLLKRTGLTENGSLATHPQGILYSFSGLYVLAGVEGFTVSGWGQAREEFECSGEMTLIEETSRESDLTYWGDRTVEFPASKFDAKLPNIFADAMIFNRSSRRTLTENCRRPARSF